MCCLEAAHLFQISHDSALVTYCMIGYGRLCPSMVRVPNKKKNTKKIVNASYKDPVLTTYGCFCIIFFPSLSYGRDQKHLITYSKWIFEDIMNKNK